MVRNRFFVVLFIIFLAVIGMGVYYSSASSKQAVDTVNLNVQGKSVKLLVADDAMEWTYGLMNRRSLKDADGMLFKFPDKQMRTFWNQNTLMDLTVVWMDGDRVIGTSELPSIEKSGQIVTVSSPGPADNVVELVR